MTARERELNVYLIKIAENLDISETMQKKAVSSYQAVGKWLGDCEHTSDVVITPQGSFALGTVIKPVDDRDEYDIDLVCLLRDKQDADSGVIKNLVGDRLKEHEKYREMLQSEGKRCWTLNYDEFHMDVLPCVPKNTVYSEPTLTELRLTHRIAPGNYIAKYSNPYKYRKWFEDRMKDILRKSMTLYADSRHVEIDSVPLYAVKTPLQRVVQLLKRHRDIMYSSTALANKDDAPISIIITTLAALAYRNETNVFDALNNILATMQNYINTRAGVYWVANPVMPEENFADKWNDAPRKRTEFFRWLTQAKEDLITEPLNMDGLNHVSAAFQKSFGENVTKKAFTAVANEVATGRKAGNLYVDTAQHLASQSDAGAKKVKEHTFFGE
jgi:hypothetical protein